jgi:protein ImuB
MAPRGCPESLRADAIHGHVLEAAGPWRTAGDWWRDDAWAHDTWDIELSDGALYILCHDHRDGRWFLAGVYD